MTPVEKFKIRSGDKVLVRLPVHATHGGSTGILFPVSASGFCEPDKFDIVSVEQAFRVGDRVQCDDGKYNGEIIGLSPESVHPVQAWIKTYPKGDLVTRGLKHLKRI